MRSRVAVVAAGQEKGMMDGTTNCLALTPWCKVRNYFFFSLPLLYEDAKEAAEETKPSDGGPDP